MGMGQRKRRGGRFNRRRSRRVRDSVPRSGIRRHGPPSDPCERNQEDILALYQAQQQMLASFKQQTRQINLDQETPVWHASHDQEQTEQVGDLQNEQLELFNDIIKQHNKETDTRKAQELYSQQCELIEQMRELQMAGYAYPGGIPSAQIASEPEGESVEMAVIDTT